MTMNLMKRCGASAMPKLLLLTVLCIGCMGKTTETERMANRLHRQLMGRRRLTLAECSKCKGAKKTGLFFKTECKKCGGTGKEAPVPEVVAPGASTQSNERSSSKEGPPALPENRDVLSAEVEHVEEEPLSEKVLQSDFFSGLGESGTLVLDDWEPLNTHLSDDVNQLNLKTDAAGEGQQQNDEVGGRLTGHEQLLETDDEQLADGGLLKLEDQRQPPQRPALDPEHPLSNGLLADADTNEQLRAGAKKNVEEKLKQLREELKNVEDTNQLRVEEEDDQAFNNQYSVAGNVRSKQIEGGFRTGCEEQNGESQTSRKSSEQMKGRLEQLLAPAGDMEPPVDTKDRKTTNKETTTVETLTSITSKATWYTSKCCSCLAFLGMGGSMYGIYELGTADYGCAFFILLAISALFFMFTCAPQDANAFRKGVLITSFSAMITLGAPAVMHEIRALVVGNSSSTDPWVWFAFGTVAAIFFVLVLGDKACGNRISLPAVVAITLGLAGIGTSIGLNCVEEFKEFTATAPAWAMLGVGCFFLIAGIGYCAAKKTRCCGLGDTIAALAIL